MGWFDFGTKPEPKRTSRVPKKLTTSPSEPSSSHITPYLGLRPWSNFHRFCCFLLYTFLILSSTTSLSVLLLSSSSSSSRLEFVHCKFGRWEKNLSDSLSLFLFLKSSSHQLHQLFGAALICFAAHSRVSAAAAAVLPACFCLISARPLSRPAYNYHSYKHTSPLSSKSFCVVKASPTCSTFWRCSLGWLLI